MPRGDLGRGDLEIALAADDDDLVADRASGTEVRSMRVCSSEGAPISGTAGRARGRGRRGASAGRRPSPSGSRRAAAARSPGTGACAAKRSRGASSLSAMTRVVSARSAGRSGTGGVSPGKRDAVEHAAGIHRVEIRVREAQHERARGQEPHRDAHAARLQLVHHPGEPAELPVGVRRIAVRPRRAGGRTARPGGGAAARAARAPSSPPAPRARRAARDRRPPSRTPRTGRSRPPRTRAPRRDRPASG